MVIIPSINHNQIAIANLNALRSNDVNEKRYDLIVSYIKNGEQLIKRNDWGSYYEWNYTKVYEDFRNQNNTKYVLAVDYYDENSTGYTGLNCNEIIFEYSGELKNISKIKYINYEEEQLTPEKAWLDFFFTILKDKVGETNSPIIITEAWEFEWNGKNAAIVTAKNTIPNNTLKWVQYNEDCGIIPIELHNDNLIIYNMTAIFIDDNPTLIKNPLIIKIDNQLKPPTTDKYGPYGVMFYSYQYDSSLNIIKRPLYATASSEQHLRDFYYTPSFLVIDIDGNKVDDIIIYNNSWEGLRRYVEIISYENNELVKYLAWANF